MFNRDFLRVVMCIGVNGGCFRGKGWGLGIVLVVRMGLGIVLGVWVGLGIILGAVREFGMNGRCMGRIKESEGSEGESIELFL